LCADRGLAALITTISAQRAPVRHPMVWGVKPLER
jgi:hypothetical protein